MILEIFDCIPYYHQGKSKNESNINEAYILGNVRGKHHPHMVPNQAHKSMPLFTSKILHFLYVSWQNI